MYNSIDNQHSHFDYLISFSDPKAHRIQIFQVWSGDLGIPLGILGSTKNGPATSVSLSPDGTAVAVGYHSCYVRVFDVTTGKFTT